MTLETILYKDYEQHLPQEGKHILSQTKGKSLFVYQAFKPAIAKYAVAHQQFGGAQYKFERMSWIKPNFLWMMYRSGWASKVGQERILAIEISKANFEKILKQAIHSSYKAAIYQTKEQWKEKLQTSEVRLQWDPDHNPQGDKLARRAIQLGLRGKTLQRFAKEWIISIEDITSFVRSEKLKLDNNDYEAFSVIKEEVISIEEEATKLRLGLTK